MVRRKITSPRVALFLAFKSLLKGNRGITFMTIAMLSMIYVNLLFVPSVIQGITNKISLQLRETLTSNVIISSSNTKKDVSNLDELLTDINKNQSVKAATGTYRVGTQISSGNITNNWTIDAVDPASFANVFKSATNILEGKFLDDSDENYIFLGVGIAGADYKNQTEYAVSLKKVHAGDTVSIKLINGQEYDFIVKGIYDNTFIYSNRNAYISNKSAEKILPMINNKATAVYVKTKSDDVEDKIGRAITKNRDDLKYQIADDMSSGIKEQVNAFDALFQIIEVFSLAVAAITVFIVTYVELINRRKQIGIERAIGIRPAAIVEVYVIKSIVLTIIGTLVGVVAFNFIFVPVVLNHPFDFPFGPVTLNVSNPDMWKYGFIMVGVSFVSALIPAVRSIRVKILDAIWGSN